MTLPILMPSITKKRTRKAGLPPESLVYTGDRVAGAVRISVIDYDADHVVEQEFASVDQCIPFRDKATVTWINVDGVQGCGSAGKAR